MKIRIIAKTELIESIVSTFNLSVKIYPSRYNAKESRIYLDLEDEIVTKQIPRINNAIVKRD